MPALRPARPADLDGIWLLETAGFPPGIVEERAVFERRVAAFPQGFLVRDSGTGDLPSAGAGPWPLSAYFCAEIWRSVPGGFLAGDPERFQLGHDIGRWHDPAGDRLYLASMTVAPHCRGTGAGRRLFAEGIAHLRRNFPALRGGVLIVNEAWEGARAIYADAGFRETGRLPGFFRALGEPERAAIAMEADWA